MNSINLYYCLYIFNFIIVWVIHGYGMYYLNNNVIYIYIYIFFIIVSFNFVLLYRLFNFMVSII